MSRIVTGYIQPIQARDLRLGMGVTLARITKSHEPEKAAPDHDHPITKAIVQQLPKLPYEDLKAVRAHIVKYGEGAMSNQRDVDGWLMLVNQELQKRDREREIASGSFVDWLISKGIAQ